MPRGFWLFWASVLPGMGSCSIPSSALHRLPLQAAGGHPPPGCEGHHVRLPRLHPCLGQVAQRGQRGPAGYGQGPLCPSAGGGEDWCRKPASAHRRPACPPVGHDAGPLRLLRRDGEQSTGVWYAHQVVRIWQRWLSRRDRQSAYTWSRLTAFRSSARCHRQDHPSLHRRERSSPEEPDAGNGGPVKRRVNPCRR